jgi:hypothetical protein
LGISAHTFLGLTTQLTSIYHEKRERESSKISYKNQNRCFGISAHTFLGLTTQLTCIYPEKREREYRNFIQKPKPLLGNLSSHVKNLCFEIPDKYVHF